MPVTFIPTKPKKDNGRVQLSAEELVTLLGIIEPEIDRRRLLEMELTVITRVYLKLARALERARALI